MQVGKIKAKDLVKRFAKIKINFPQRIFNFLINTLIDQKPTESYMLSDECIFDPEAILSFEKLQSLIMIYNRCPVSTKGYTNNSNKIRKMLVMPGHDQDIDDGDDDR
jgi:hypothetical protein